MSSRRAFLAGLCGGLLALPGAAVAQQKERTWRLGFLSSRRRPESIESEFHGQMVHTLHDLGYVDGKSLVIDWRYAGGDYSLLPGLAAELVRLPVDVIVTDGTPGIRAAQAATKAIPIVFAGGSDLVANGIVRSLSHPGGNTTGATLMFDDTTGKQLELLTRLVPTLRRAAVLFNPDNPASVRQLRDYRAAATLLKVEIASVGSRNAEEIANAFPPLAGSRCGALLWTVDTYFFQQRVQLAELSARHRLPSACGYPEYAEAGGLMGYGPDRRDIYRRVAVYVDKILKGANPGDLPVEQPTRIDLVINRTTAKAFGLTIPAELLLLAEKIVG